ncbi:MAG: hypothetical protein CJD30_01560 [Sulfuricurvum sp. PD_MW2]|jgi:hypothetical protein|uniref:hypothetical protein n=1 Tax=Sulfuricurvum sp. PD_MW2 TaxID=2027917 RepID=UPI000C05DE15|nr:hypothetical protein [Sulfuricurvum sp. PD_MW2]PHM18626.1 MAG: hypothetical protein CJD30_01560 [Sulfuricurvum sp. PD_MW2]
MNYFWSFLFLTLSLNAAYNPFFRESVKPKKTPVATSEVRPMPLPPLLAPPIVPTEKPATFDLSKLVYNCYLETEKGKFILLKIGDNKVVLKEGDPFYANNKKYFIRNITSNYITVDDSGRIQTIYFTTGGQ